MEKNEFELLMMALVGLKTDVMGEIKRLDINVTRIETKVDVGFADVRKDLSGLRKDLSIVRNQTANLTERVSLLESSKHPTN